MKVSVKYLGRFGNNLIQLFNAIILSYFFNNELIYDLDTLKDGLLLNEDMYYRIFEFVTDNSRLNIQVVKQMLKEYYPECNPYAFLRMSDTLILNNFYQQSAHLFKFRNIVLNSSPDQIVYYHNKFGDQAGMIGLKFSDLFQLHPQMTKEDIIVHIRLGDFIKQPTHEKLLIIHPDFYINEINKFEGLSVLIVVEEPTEDVEKKYIQYILDRVNKDTKLQHSHLLNDWLTIRNAKYVIGSNSTFCWSACYLNQRAERIVYPETDYYPSQKLGECEERWRVEKLKIDNLININNFFLEDK